MGVPPAPMTLTTSGSARFSSASIFLFASLTLTTS